MARAGTQPKKDNVAENCVLELGRYARRVGKTVDKLTAEEILQFKIP